MTKKRTTKSSLLVSALSLLLCISMFIGSTFAWFTDSVTSKKNIIASGNLDVEMYHSNLAVTEEKVDENTTLFNDLNGEAMLWEPGAASFENLKVVNEGELALAYSLSILTDNENYVLDPSGEQYGLSQILKVGVVEGGFTATDREGVLNSVDEANWMTLQEFVFEGKLLPKDAGVSENTYGVVVYWEPSANDNNWNLNNGKELSDGEELSIDLGVHLVATQEEFEADSFGTDYDANATFPEIKQRFRAAAFIIGKVDENNKLTEDVTIGSVNGRMHAVVPEGTLIAPNKLRLVLTVETTSRSNNIEMVSGQVSRSLDVHISGIDEENTVPITIDLGEVMPKGLKDSSIQIYHVENATPNQMEAVDTLTAHNQFVYNVATGEMSVNMATFSEVTMVVAPGNPWDGKIDTSWYNTDDTEFTITTAEQFAGLGAIVGGMAEGIEQDNFAGKTVKLGANLDLGSKNGKVWYPIGYYNNLKSYEKVSGGSITSDIESFEGVFDGNKKTISNIYQNTWDMFGDYNSGYSGTPNHYKDGMGIFGFVYNGTIKDLTVNNFQSDGEFATTGCVAAYASGSSNFENITIINSNPRAYNVPNGGVVGYAYAENGATNVINFNNIKVDTSNKITALWGSWDVGCGGVLGRVNGATTVNMSNCEVAAEIDVYNDVCGNYQYYQYRYSGMLIGTVGGDGDPKSGSEKVDFTNVKVYIGNWADYYYCEFEKNSQGSYTDDYQFSRVEKNEIVFDDETNLPKTCTHTHQGTEDKLAVYLPFNQLYTGYGYGASPELISEYGKEVNGVTVYRSFYSVTYMTADGKTVLATDYVTSGVRTESKIWADEYTVKTSSISTAASGQVFQGWRNSASVVKTKINAGNRDNIILYESWDNPFTIRFVDQFGDVIYSETFTNSDTKVSEPEVPRIENFSGVWEKYDLSTATGDITVRPIYSYKGNLSLIPIDDDQDGDVDYYQVAGYGDGDDKTVVEIPAYVNGIPVKEINDKAFSSYDDLHSVVIPSTITGMGYHALPGEWTWLVGGGEEVTLYYEGSCAEWIELEKTFDEKWDEGLGKNSRIFFMNGTGKVDPSQGYLLAGHKTSWGSVQSVTWTSSTVTTSLKTTYTGTCNCGVNGCKGNTRPDAKYWEGVEI